MTSKAKERARTHGQADFSLDSSHLQAAQDSGLLRPETMAERGNKKAEDYGVAYDRQGNIGTDAFESQKSIQSRCKDFASRCGFQLYVKHSSVKANNSGNAKYKCKLLNGQQFFDTETASDTMECPFFLNVFGSNGQWKLTEANFCHNHSLFVGSTQRPLVEGVVPRPAKDKRNTTRHVKNLTNLVKRKMLPAHNGSLSTMTGTAIQTFLLAEGADRVSMSTISRIKHNLDDVLHGDRLESYQKLEGYFKLMADKNPGSVWRFEREHDGLTFKRACFFPSAGLHAALMAKRLFGFDGAHLKGEMHQRGVFLVATAKDFNNHIIPFGFALVPVENYDNWRWFLEVVKSALGDLERFVAVSDRQKGLLSAVADVFPLAGHRFCLRHIMDNVNRSGCSLTADERRLICCMARNDCENDFNLYESELHETKSAAVVYLKTVEAKHWVKFRFQEEFKLPTYGEITSNLSEQANNWMTNDLRSAKPLDAFHLYFLKLGELFSEKRQIAARWLDKGDSDDLVPVMARQRNDLVKAAKLCKFTACMEGAYSVQHLGPASAGGYNHPWRLVDLPAQECTCGNWQDGAFPCVHAICAAIADGRPLASLYDAKILSIRHFTNMYTHVFRPWPIDISLESDVSVLLPAVTAEPREKGKRGLKPGPKPKHKRKKAKSGI